MFGTGQHVRRDQKKLLMGSLQSRTMALHDGAIINDQYLRFELIMIIAMIIRHNVQELSEVSCQQKCSDHSTQPWLGLPWLEKGSS